MGWSEPEQRQALSIYGELLILVDENSSEFNICAILRNQAISFRYLKDYDAALVNLKEELRISRKRGDRLREMECQRIIVETNESKQRDGILANGGQRAKKFREMEELSRKLCKETNWRYCPQEVPSDLEPALRTELEQLMKPRLN